MSEIACVTGLRNRPYRHTRKFFESLCHQTIPIDIVVVDYGGTPMHLGWERRMFDHPNVKLVEVIRGTEIWNEARSLNIGIKTAITPYIFAVNADIIFCENYAESIVDVLKNNPNVLVTSRRIDLDIKGRPTTAFMPEYYYGTCIAARRELFYDLHGFDETYVASFLDTDFVGRARDCEFKVVNISDRTACFHQYHKNYTNIRSQDEQKAFDEAYLVGQEHSRVLNKPRVRNPNGWGEL